MTVDLFQLGVYLRCPDVASVPDQKAAGVKWALMSLNNDPCVQDPAAWDFSRAEYRKHGVPQGPWKHCQRFDQIAPFIDRALVWNEGKPADVLGLNLEDVVSGGYSLADVAALVKERWTIPTGGAPVHMATLPWVQNGQGWHHVADYYAALELFPLEAPLYVKEWQACIDHAFAEGLKKVTLLYSTTSPRSTYPNVAHCLYTADNVSDWHEWTDTVPQPIPQPPSPPEVPPVPLTKAQFPYTGPLYGPSSPKGPTQNRATIKGLKRAMIRAKYLNLPLGSETDDYGAALESALRVYQRECGIPSPSGQYGHATWTALRYEKLTSGPNKGQYALDVLARKYVQQDALMRCYPHPVNAVSAICQGLHETDDLGGSWAIDFCAPGGTKVLAVENAEITRLSGHDPSQGWWGPGIFGWSVTYETAAGYSYFSTHYGSRAPGLAEGVQVDCGQVLGLVGSWPGDPARSHTHLSVRSPLGIADAKKRILAISVSPKVAA